MTAERTGDVVRKMAIGLFEACIVLPLLGPFTLKQALRARSDPAERNEIVQTMVGDARYFGESMGIMGRVAIMFFPTEEKREAGRRVSAALRLYEEGRYLRHG